MTIITMLHDGRVCALTLKVSGDLLDLLILSRKVAATSNLKYLED